MAELIHAAVEGLMPLGTLLLKHHPGKHNSHQFQWNAKLLHTRISGVMQFMHIYLLAPMHELSMPFHGANASGL